MADVITEICKKEIDFIKETCSSHQVMYDMKNLAISTFAYYYIIFIFNYKSITGGQEMDVQDFFIEKFSEFNRNEFQDTPFKSVLENENVFESKLKFVDRRVRKSYQANNYQFVDDGLSSEYILEFLEQHEDIYKIKETIALRIKDIVEYASKMDDESCLE